MSTTLFLCCRCAATHAIAPQPDEFIGMRRGFGRPIRRALSAVGPPPRTPIAMPMARGNAFIAHAPGELVVGRRPGQGAAVSLHPSEHLEERSRHRRVPRALRGPPGKGAALL